MSQPETRPGRHYLRDRQVIAGERADDDQDQGPEQQVDTQLLMLRIATVDDRPKEQPRRQKRGRNPQHRALHMPGAGQRIGEMLRDRSEERREGKEGVSTGRDWW